MFDLDGKVVVVTGASRGQGRAEALALAHAGATVVATDIAEPPDVEVPGVSFHRLDVTAPGDWTRLSAALRAEHGGVHGLVNNAGAAHRVRLEHVEPEDWNRTLAVNVTGPLLGIQALAPLMTDGGSIVNVGSTAALTAHPAAAYTTSKWALRGLSRVAALELGPRGIRVNLIHPGNIETEMLAGARPELLQAALALTPLGRAGSVDDIAPAVVFLMSDASSYITGTELPVDGGQTSHGGAKLLADALSAIDCA